MAVKKTTTTKSKRPRGRPKGTRKFDDPLNCGKLFQLLEFGCSFEIACKALGIANNTLLNARKSNLKFNEKVETSKAKGIANLTTSVYKAGLKNAKIAIRMLETLEPKRWAERPSGFIAPEDFADECLKNVERTLAVLPAEYHEIVRQYATEFTINLTAGAMERQQVSFEFNRITEHVADANPNPVIEPVVELETNPPEPIESKNEYESAPPESSG